MVECVEKPAAMIRGFVEHGLVERFAPPFGSLESCGLRYSVEQSALNNWKEHGN
uniref:Uncharacterized protein n=1 Tax=Rubinisphaera brasiliensis (strain ATCC 49424 / DSM 5305 / JCM 21570 / IAM 15109 / NBRC 103401 / IFAM 1448) TaxID=756272 RepID=F0SI31_RUBBR|nr:hypothetical protein Plabr_4159 [Rubinisphaera brasiliensis DSM 5305]